MYIYVKDEALARITTALLSIDPELKISNNNFMRTSKDIRAFLGTMFNFEKLKDEWYVFVFHKNDTDTKVQIRLDDLRTVYDL